MKASRASETTPANDNGPAAAGGYDATPHANSAMWPYATGAVNAAGAYDCIGVAGGQSQTRRKNGKRQTHQSCKLHDEFAHLATLK